MECRPTPVHPIKCGFQAYQQIPEKAPAPDIHGHSRASCQSPHFWSAVLRSLMAIDHPRVIRYGLDFLTQEYRTKSYTTQSIDTRTSLTCIKNLNKVHQPRLVVETLGLFMPCRMVQKRRQEEETLRITGIKSPWAIQLDVGTEFHEATYKHKCFVCFLESSNQVMTCNPSKMKTFCNLYTSGFTKKVDPQVPTKHRILWFCPKHTEASKADKPAVLCWSFCTPGKYSRIPCAHSSSADITPGT